MKKNYLLAVNIVLIMITAYVISSCKKENSEPQSSNFPTSSVALRENGKDLRIWHDNGGPKDGVDYGCWNTPGNCGPDVVVVGNLYRGIVTDVFNGIESGEDIPGTFRNNIDYLYSVLDTPTVDGVINGTTIVSKKGTSLSEHLYMVFTIDQRIDYVSPFRED